MSKVKNILEGLELEGGSSSSLKSLENITVREIVSKKGEGGIGSSWISCRAEDTAIDAVQNVGSFVWFLPFSKAGMFFPWKNEDFFFVADG